MGLRYARCMVSKGTVLVGMSGGVDSSVTAAVLQDAGYSVIGSQMKLLHGIGGVDHGCCGPAALRDAQAVAEHLGIEFEVFDVAERFEETVLDDFFSEHQAGRTPNPCARCNEHIKFRAFVERADALGCDFVATGHYARIWSDPGGRWHLSRGIDATKDQSYLLHMLGQRQLSRTLLPLGGNTKVETRAVAEQLGLVVADKPDSQEVCFVPDGDHAAFVEEYLPDLVQEGEVVDERGDVLGTHRGSFRFTVGQRKGIGVATHQKRYVLEMDAESNRVVVGPGELLARRGLKADRVTWVAGSPPQGPFEATVQVRYNGQDVPAVVAPSTGSGPAESDVVSVEFRSPQRAIAPGQSVVFYRGDELLGGGRIIESIR